jgi:hypothetical protein
MLPRMSDAERNPAAISDEPVGPNNCETVGALRAALASLPDDARLFVQVVAHDGTAWNMSSRVEAVDTRKVPTIHWDDPVLLLQVSHHHLKTMPPFTPASPD